MAGQAIGVSVSVIKPDLPPQLPVFTERDDAKNQQETIQPSLEAINTPGDIVTSTIIDPITKNEQFSKPDKSDLQNLNNQQSDLVENKKAAALKKNANNKKSRKSEVSAAKAINLSEKPIADTTKPISIATSIKPMKSHRMQLDTKSKADGQHSFMEEQNQIAEKQPAGQMTTPSAIPAAVSSIINQSIIQQQLITALDSGQQREKQKEEAVPDIRIEIGKIEVRTKAPQPIARSPARMQSAKLSLQNYLKQRNGEV